MKIKPMNRLPLLAAHLACIAIFVLWQPFSSFVVSAAASHGYHEDHFLPTMLRSTAVDLKQCNTECVGSMKETSGCLGFAGDDCSFPFVVCPDSVTQCFGPYAKCVDKSATPNARDYKCECEVPSSMEIELMTKETRIQDCLERITEICVKNSTVSPYSFCTNGGECVEQIEEGEAHPGCVCPGRFVGRHCEKRRGTGTDYRYGELDRFDDPIDTPGTIQNRRVGTSMGLILAILASVLAGVLAVLYKRFLVTHNATPLEDENSINAKTRIHVITGGNENVPTVN